MMQKIPSLLGIVVVFGLFAAVLCFLLVNSTQPRLYLDYTIDVNERSSLVDSDAVTVSSTTEEWTDLELDLRTTTVETVAEEEPYTPPTKKPNVLFLMTDDMRAQLGCYQNNRSPLSHPALFTPNLDKLASRSLLMKNAFVQFGLCGPSRTSILTSRRPDTTRIFDNRNYWREFGGNFTTIPQYFKQNGYFTVGIGKVFHRDVSSNENDPISWSVPYIMPKHSEGSYLTDGEASWFPVTKRQRAKVELMDTMSVDLAEKVLRKLAPKARTGEQPFFLALGFKKPHSSYICPKEFFDLYEVESEDQFLKDLSWQTVSFKRKRNLTNVTITSEGDVQLPHEALRELRRAYFACISYVDSLVGNVVQVLDKLSLSKSTIISFVADHGYHFGENAVYGKQSLFDTGTRVPLMMHIPGRTDSGVVSNSIVEALDLFPTLVDAAGLPPLEKCPLKSKNVETCTQGMSFLSLISNPRKVIKPAAFTQRADTLQYMRYTMRTSRFRYTEWTRCHRDTHAEGTYIIGGMNPPGMPAELYDHKHDPDERHNLVDTPRYSQIKQKLSRKLQSVIPQM